MAFTGLMRHDAVVPVCCDRDASGDLMTSGIMGAHAHGGIDVHNDGIATVPQPMPAQGVVETPPEKSGLTARETFRARAS